MKEALHALLPIVLLAVAVSACGGRTLLDEQRPFATEVATSPLTCGPPPMRGLFTASDVFALHDAIDLVASNSDNRLELVARWEPTFTTESTGARVREDKQNHLFIETLDDDEDWFNQLQPGLTISALLIIQGPTRSSCTATTARSYGGTSSTSGRGQLSITARTATSISGTFNTDGATLSSGTFTFEAPIVSNDNVEAYPSVCCF